MIAFGPVPSRRLGKSIGINNIPPKICTYSCVYCQLGLAIQMTASRKAYYSQQEIIQAVHQKIDQAGTDSVDYLTFVPDGEPTLDINLGSTVKALQETGIKTAIITNSSLLWKPDVREDLLAFDWVSLKVDAVNHTAWKKTDRPYKTLNLEKIKQGMLDFSRQYQGGLVTESMLVQDYNTDEETLEAIATFVEKLKPAKKYLAIPTRPPALSKIKPASEAQLAKAYQIFSQIPGKTEYLIGYEGNAFAAGGNAEEDILSITAVHPMREDAMDELLKNDQADWQVVHKLIENGKLIEATYSGHRFYVRKLREKQMKQ